MDAPAHPITSQPTQVKEHTQSARSEPGEPTDIPCGDPISQPQSTVWFSFTPTTTQKLNMNTSRSTHYTRIAVFTGTSVESLTLVPGACDCDNATNLASVTFTVTAGTKYYIQIGVAGGAQDLVANFSEAPWSAKRIRLCAKT